MCDTLYKKIGNDALFLKNSDRSANEPNLVMFYSRRKAEGILRCTYISIPDEDSFSVLLYKPSWMWGAEMGINQFGVTVGNEAVWTKSKNKKNEKLLGMDMVRLALERGSTAKRALDIILDLLNKYGQGGNAGYDHSFYYDNSFLIADKNEAYVLETAGKEWAWRPAGEQSNISNRLSIESDYFSSSSEGNFKKTNIEHVFSFFSGSKQRKAQGERSLNEISDFSKKSAFRILRSHYDGSCDKKLFSKGSVKSLCMHSGGLADHTTGSMAVFFEGGKPYIWVTGSSTPCLSAFKPVFFGKIGAPVFDDEKSSVDYWLKRELVNRAIYCGVINASQHREKISALENSFIDKADRIISSGSGDGEYSKFCAECAENEQELYDSYDGLVSVIEKDPKILGRYWFNKTLKLGKNVFEKDLCKRK